MCWGLATARHCTPELNHLLNQGLLLESLVELKPRQVTALLWGCAILLHRPHAVLRSLAVMLGTGSVSGMSVQRLCAHTTAWCHSFYAHVVKQDHAARLDHMAEWQQICEPQGTCTFWVSNDASLAQVCPGFS